MMKGEKGAMNLEVREFPISELHTYRRNPRRGDVDAIASSLRKRGQYRPIVVNLGTNASKRMEILAGNHTYLAAKQLGGSGSTLIAAYDLKMRAVLCELDPRYGDVICRRFQEHTGIIPRCDGKEHDFTTE